jgi:general nucleoside transport system permease protein
MKRVVGILKQQFGPAAFAFAIAILIASLALILSGHNPLRAYGAMWDNINGTSGIVTIINEMAPLYVAACALALGFKMNLFNIGANGQFVFGALMGAAAGAEVSLPAPLHVLFIFVVAAISGAFLAGIAGVLKVTRGVNEVVSTIMLNGIAGSVGGYLLRIYFRAPGDQAAHTKTLANSAHLPNLDRVLSAVGFHNPKSTPLFSFPIFALLVGIAFYVLIYRSRFGFDLRASGINTSAARSSGVSPKRMIIVTMLMSGALAGLSGMSTLLQKQYEYGDRFPTLVGFTAIGIALLGQNHPVGIAFAATIWAAIEQGARGLPIVKVPSEIGTTLQGSFLFVAVIVYSVTQRSSQAKAIEAASKRMAAGTSGSGSSGSGGSTGSGPALATGATV